MSAVDTSRTLVRAPFGGRERSFQLRLGEISELERICDAGIGEIMLRLGSHRFGVDDVWEPIRLGLEGAGASPVEAEALVMRYHPPHYPIAEFLDLAARIVTASVSGVAAPGKDRAEGSGAEPAPETSPSSSAPGRSRVSRRTR